MYQHEGILITVDCIVFGYEDDLLKILLFKRWIEPSKDQLSLLGGWVNKNESVDDASRRVLQTITGLENIYMEMVDVFSEVHRDPGGRVISIAYYALMPITEENKKVVESHSAEWYPVHEMPELIFDHNQMLEQALSKLRSNATTSLIGKQLLPKRFTLLQLRKLYNAIFQVEFDPGNFRKKVLSLKVLEQLDIKDTSESKKGAYFYRFKEDGSNDNNNQIFKVDY